MELQSKKIAAVRSKAKLSRQKFAEKLGFSKSYITDVETGRAKPSRRLLEAISKEFNISIDWILNESLILDMIEENKKSLHPKIFFWFGFTQEELNEAERYLQNFLLKEKKTIYIDASKAGSLTQLLKMLVNKPGNSEKLNRIFRKMLFDEPLIIVLKSISLSNIPHKDSGKFIKNILNLLSYEWAENKEIDGNFIRKYKKTFCSVILIDFPSYLEVNMKTFGHHTVRINQSTIAAPDF